MARTIHHRPSLAAFCATVALFSFPGEASAQTAGGFEVQKPARTRVESWHEADLVAVKFRDGLTVRVDGTELVDRGTGALDFARPVLAQTVRGRWARAHHESEAVLQRLRADGEARAGRALPDLNLEFRVRLDPGVAAAAAIDALNALPIVELAWPVARPAPPPVVPDFTLSQGYLNAATAGIDARAAWPLPAGTASNARICDIEYEFNASHVDLPPITIVGPPWLPAGYGTDHATAVLGALFGRANGAGITGGAHGAQAFFAAAYTASGWNVGAAITTATNALSTGDVILIEQQMVGPAGGTAYVPSEWDLSVYNATRTAVANGIIVVAAAGNGFQNLDAAIYSAGHAPFLPANDSGAILVGAGASPGGSTTDRSRLSFSNYGSTVDLQGWGENVFTCGYGTAYAGTGANEWYTATFNGTSSASPIVAAACALVSSMHEERTGWPMAPTLLRDALRATGSPQQSGINPSSQNIGPRPNVAGALTSLGLWRCHDDDPWTLAGVAPFGGRRYMAMAYDSARRRVVAFGGAHTPFVYEGDTWQWSGSAWSLVTTSGPPARQLASMAYDSKRDRLVLFGGQNGSSSSLTDTWEFDGSSWALRATTGPVTASAQRMVYDEARAVVVMIGSSPFAAAATWEWNGTSWTQFSGPAPRQTPALAYDAVRQRVVMFGGYLTASDSGETWERAGTTWSLVSASGPAPRSFAGLHYDPARKRCVLFGGHQSSPFVRYDDTWEWDGAAWRLASSGGAPERTYFSSAFHEDAGHMLVFGGDTDTTLIDDDTWIRARTAEPGVPFCFGDGSGVACPCANPSAVGACVGCLNSLGNGGKLRSSGIASLSSPTVVLLGSGMPDSSALYFQGTLQQAGGAGVVFGDGLRCAAGSVLRFAPQINSGGASSYPGAGQPSIPAAGALTAPATRAYQVWYRNASTFCTASTFNLTNGLQISWGV